MKADSTVVIHIPHAATAIPSRLRSRIILSDKALAHELVAMTDLYTDELFTLPAMNYKIVKFPISRLIVDPERFLENDVEPMAKCGMGVIYTSTSEKEVLRDNPSASERAELIAEFYKPHHEALTQAVDSCLLSSGVCLVLDCHSFPKYPLPYELDQDPNRPDICIGTDDAFHSPPWIGQLSQDYFQTAGYSVAINRPFKGALVPEKHHRVTPNVYALMLEVNRGLYMDHLTGERRADFSDFKLRFQGVIASLIDKVVVRLVS